MTEYELNQLINPKKDMIKTKSKHRQPLETLIQGRRNELNSTLLTPSIRLTFTLSEPSKERISVKGDLSMLKGSADADGLSNVKEIRIDGKTIDITTDITIDHVVEISEDTFVDAYFYDFTTVGKHTIEYFLDKPIANDGICAILGKCSLFGFIEFDSKISDLEIEMKDITEIKNTSFSLSNINSITLPESITVVEDYAFTFCTGLPSVDNVMYINIYAIGVTDNTLSEYTIKNGTTRLMAGTFTDCQDLINIIIPDTVTRIADGAFSSCESLSSITIPSSVTSIGDNAFRSCISLSGVIMKSTIPPTLGANAFYETNDCPIYVPSASVNTYKTASGWNRYTNRIQPIPTE